MKEETIIKLMHGEASKLTGKIAAFGKYQDKFSFLYDAREIISSLSELSDELEKLWEQLK